MTERVKENSSERFQDNGLESEGSERTKQLAMEREPVSYTHLSAMRCITALGSRMV